MSYRESISNELYISKSNEKGLWIFSSERKNKWADGQI